MRLNCRLRMHRAMPTERWNDGYYFTRCCDCGVDLIRRSHKWRPVPKGYKVVWKPRTKRDIDWTAWSLQRRTTILQPEHRAETR